MYACHRPGHSTQQAPVTYAQTEMEKRMRVLSFLINLLWQYVTLTIEFKNKVWHPQKLFKVLPQ